MSRTKLSLIVLAALLSGAALELLASGLAADASIAGPSVARASESLRPPAALRSEPVAHAFAAPVAPAPETRGLQHSGIHWVDGRVTVHLREASLASTLEQIARASRVELEGAENLGGSTVSIDFDDLPVAEALLRLTEGHDSAFKYGSTDRGTAGLVGFAIGGAEPARSQPDLDAQLQRLDDRDPERRADAIETVAQLGGEQARPAVMRALADADEDVRLRALEQAQVVRTLAIPTEVLRTLVAQDVSENVRLKALDVLATSPRIDAATLERIALGAQSDSSELVRDRAAELRRQLESRAQQAER